MRIRNVLAAITAVAAMSFCSGTLAGECKLPLIRVASFPMTMHPTGWITVPVPLNGVETTMLVDTGAYYSGLMPGAAKRLGMDPKPLTDVQMVFLGNEKSGMHVVADTMRIGRSDLRNRPLFVLPEGRLPDDIDGILGSEILTVFDVDLDYAAGKMNFFWQKHCEGRVVYWTHPEAAAVLSFRTNDNRDILLKEVMLDGKPIRVLLDTGATNTVMSLRSAAYLFDLDEDELLRKPGSHAFKTLSFGGVEVRNPVIALQPNDNTNMLGGFGNPQMLLGENVLRALHLYIAYKEHKIYITPASVDIAPHASPSESEGK